jgi:large subunit ribosomal protein L32
MAAPKKKTTRAKKLQRRAQNWKIKLPEISKCPNCGTEVRPYHMCTSCGQYKGKQILAAAQKDSD